MNRRKLRILSRAIPVAVLILILKFFVLAKFEIGGLPMHELIEISDLSVVFTGAFFVMALMLAGTMSDFKESEKIPGEAASMLESIQDWSILAFKAARTGSNELSKEPLDAVYIHSTIKNVATGIHDWFKSTEKDSFVIFPLLRKLNGISYYFAERGVDKEAIKGVQENTNALRKQISRAYAISKTNFLSIAYILLMGIVAFMIILLLVTKFKTGPAEIIVTFIMSFVFIYLYQLIITLDDPFLNYDGKADVDFRPLERFISRLGNELNLNYNERN
jgi:hypothetical protein